MRTWHRTLVVAGLLMAVACGDDGAVEDDAGTVGAEDASTGSEPDASTDDEDDAGVDEDAGPCPGECVDRDGMCREVGEFWMRGDLQCTCGEDLRAMCMGSGGG